MDVFWELLGTLDTLGSNLNAMQIVLLATLSAITIFRRQISCNHCYVEQEQEQEQVAPVVSAAAAAAGHSAAISENETTAVVLLRRTSSTWSDADAEILLDGAGRYSTYMQPVVERLWELVSAFSAGILAFFALHHQQQQQQRQQKERMLSAQQQPQQSQSQQQQQQQQSPPSTATAAVVAAQQKLTRDVSVTDFLDSAGWYCSGFPYTAALLHPLSQDTAPKGPEFSFPSLPADVQVQILSFLHPKDLLSLACVTKACQKAVDEPNVWKSLWHRDYSWLIESWEVGRKALQRSGKSIAVDYKTLFSKDFYFRFALTYMNYVLAGQNTFDNCLVGIGGHIYDLSLFLASHPGSPETVMAHAGQEATMFFHGINHSRGARQIAQSLCVAVDLSYINRDWCGTKPTRQTALIRRRCIQKQQRLQLQRQASLVDGTAATAANTHREDDHDEEDDVHRIATRCVSPPITFSSSHTNNMVKGTLQRVRDALRCEEIQYRAAIDQYQRKEVSSLLGEVNLFYDPMQQAWKAWYTDRTLRTVFLDELNTTTQTEEATSGPMVA